MSEKSVVVVACDLALSLLAERRLFRAKRLVTGFEVNCLMSIYKPYSLEGFFGLGLFAYWMRLLMQESL